MVDTVRNEIAGAFRLHQAGELGAAARAYQAVPSGAPDQADALHHEPRQRPAVALDPRLAIDRTNLTLFLCELAIPHCHIRNFD